MPPGRGAGRRPPGRRRDRARGSRARRGRWRRPGGSGSRAGARPAGPRAAAGWSSRPASRASSQATPSRRAAVWAMTPTWLGPCPTSSGIRARSSAAPGPAIARAALSPAQVPGLRGRHQRQAALGARHAQVRHEVRVADHERRVDLVGDDPHAVPLGERGDGGQFLGGVDGAGRVVGAAQQVGGPAPVRDSLPERLLQDSEVEAPVRPERRLDDAPVHVLDELVERRINRRVHDHRVARPGDQFEHLDDAQHDVGHDRGALHGEPVPVPPLLGEGGQGLARRRCRRGSRCRRGRARR